MKGEWCYFKSYFSKEYCNLLIEKSIECDFTYGKMGTDNQDFNLDQRNVMCLNLDRNIFSHFYDELWKLQVIANNQWFNFSVDENEIIQMLKYEGKVGGKYERHKDTFWVTPDEKHRKITAVIQLSDSNSYLGGDLTLFDCIEYPDRKEIREQGTVIFFPSFIFHKVNEVTYGTRYSAVSWFLGSKFR
jgi:PKHD-type hydroxylase